MLWTFCLRSITHEIKEANKETWPQFRNSLAPGVRAATSAPEPPQVLAGAAAAAAAAGASFWQQAPGEEPEMEERQNPPKKQRSSSQWNYPFSCCSGFSEKKKHK